MTGSRTASRGPAGSTTRAAARRFDAWAGSRVGRRGRRPVVDRIMYTASALGDDGRIWIGLSAAMAVGRPRPVRRFIHSVLWLGVESAFVDGAVKAVVRRPRPAFHELHPHRLRLPTDTSFPSGHAASAGMMAMVLSEGQWSRSWLWALAGTIAVSRVYVGVHHPSDAAAGFAIGATIGYAALMVERRMVDGVAPDPQPPDAPRSDSGDQSALISRR